MLKKSDKNLMSCLEGQHFVYWEGRKPIGFCCNHDTISNSCPVSIYSWYQFEDKLKFSSKDFSMLWRGGVLFDSSLTIMLFLPLTMFSVTWELVLKLPWQVPRDWFLQLTLLMAFHFDHLRHHQSLTHPSSVAIFQSAQTKRWFGTRRGMGKACGTLLKVMGRRSSSTRWKWCGFGPKQLNPS